MIRDEFEKQENKPISSKEVLQIKKLGERGYYTSRIMKLKDLRRPMKISAIISIVSSLLILPITILAAIVDTTMLSSARFWIYTILGAILLLFGIVWLAIVWPILNKKVKYYEKELKIINERELEKKRKAYETIIKPNQK